MASAITSKRLLNNSTDRDHSYLVCHEWKDMFTRMFFKILLLFKKKKTRKKMNIHLKND